MTVQNPLLEPQLLPKPNCIVFNKRIPKRFFKKTEPFKPAWIWYRWN